MSVLTTLRKAKRMSERQAAVATDMARETVRGCERAIRQAKIEHTIKLAALLERQVLLAVVPDRPAVSDLSTVAVSMAVLRDGFDSWKVHFMDLVDEFRRSLDVRLLLLPPVKNLDERLCALLASIADALCAEAGVETPEWVRRDYFLARPWFVSGIESLKASSLVESAPAFRRNNIFVQENFLRRA